MDGLPRNHLDADLHLEAILEDTARSLAKHGFTLVLFVGDSGDSQESQKRVAEALSSEGLRVVHVDSYYADNGQTEWLETQGFTVDQNGEHAGIRDSSELLYVHPASVRRQALRSSNAQAGVHGSHWKASPEIGKKMIELKVNAAVKQIESLRAAE